MTNRTDTRTSAPVAVDCPWCGQPVETTLDAPILRCAACATEVAFADEAGGREMTRGREDRVAA